MNYPALNSIDGSIKRIVVLGGGMTGWTVAAGLANGLQGLNIELMVVEDENYNEQDRYCETSTPSVLAFHKLLGIKEQDLVAKAGASYKLATHYNQWASIRQDYYLPFSVHGFMLNRIEFPHYALCRHRQDQVLPYDDYALSAVAAKLGRFQHPSPEANSLYSTLNYGLNLPCKKYASYLQSYAQHLGVQVIAGSLTQVIKSPVNDAIESIVVKGLSPAGSTAGATHERKISADFFIDCSGFSARLIAQEYGLAYIKNDSLLANASVAMVTPVADVGSPSTTLNLAPAGWLANTVTQDASELRYFFNTNYTDQDQAMQWLLKDSATNYSSSTIKVGGHDYSQYQISLHPPGRREKSWQKNCVAIGESSGYLESFVVGKLHLVQSAVLRLLSLFPSLGDCSENRDEYNRLTEIEFEHISDFHALHYKFANTMDLLTKDSPFWRAANTAGISERNQYRLTLFKQRGTVPFYENETISTSMWTSFLLGNQLIPSRNDPLVDAMDPEWISNQLDKMKKLMLSAAQAMPTQAHYLNRLTKVH